MTNSLVIFPSLNGRQKHPPLINKDIINFLINFNQDGGLRKAFLPFKEKTTYCNIDDFGCSIDIDTPKDYKNLLEYNLMIYLQYKMVIYYHIFLFIFLFFFIFIYFLFFFFFLILLIYLLLIV